MSALWVTVGAEQKHSDSLARKSPLDGDAERISVALRAMGLTHGPRAPHANTAPLALVAHASAKKKKEKKDASAMGCAHGA